MAFDKGGTWSVVFRCPADDYAHDHHLRVAGTDNERIVHDHVLHRHANPDVRIVSIKRAGDDEIAAIASQIVKDGGPTYRHLQPGEQYLTRQQVAALRGQAIPKIDPGETPEAKHARAVAADRAAMVAAFEPEQP